MIDHEVEGRQILTNEGGPLRIRYIRRLTDYGLYPASLQEAISARLAMKMAHWMTGKSNFLQIAQGLYQDAMEGAFVSDAVQGTAPRAYDSAWTDSR